MAVQELFPETQVTIGPIIEDGFYYDFARKEPFTNEDLEKIEKKMKEIVEKDEPTTREVWERKKAKDHYKKIGENYKVELVDSIPGDQEVSVYYHGKWYDLCRGPHLTSTGKMIGSATDIIPSEAMSFDIYLTNSCAVIKKEAPFSGKLFQSLSKGVVIANTRPLPVCLSTMAGELSSEVKDAITLGGDIESSFSSNSEFHHLNTLT